jgi:adenylate kinase family enzyme
MRIAILGNSGSGKSTLAKRLAASSGVAVLDLDTVAWEPDQIAVPRPRDLALTDVEAFCSEHPSWIVEGCYAGLIEGTLRHSPILLFLEPGLEQCLENCRNRPWEPHKYKSKAEQDERLPFLLSWVAEYFTREGELSLKAHEALFASYQGPKQRLSSLSGLRSIF